MRLHAELRPQFAERIRQSGPTSIALVAGQLATFAVAQVEPLKTLVRVGHDASAHAGLRIAEENASNLFYILYAGPAEEGRSAEDLAGQFLAYRHNDRAKFAKKSKAQFEQQYHNGTVPSYAPKDLAAFQTLFQAIEAKRQAVRNQYPKMGDGRWHSLTKEDQTTRVLRHLPAFAEEAREVWESMASSTSIYNFQLHASPILFQEDPAQLSAEEILELPKATPTDSLGWSALAIKLAKVSWLAFGEALGELTLVQEAFKGIDEEIVGKMLERLRKPAMIRIS